MEFTEQHHQAIDYGIDFYAPQTVVAPDGRRIMIGWMQNWDTCTVHPQTALWFGQMSLPRELSVRDGRLFQNPVRELEALRRNRREYRQVECADVVRLEGVSGRLVDLELVVRPAEGKELYRKFAVRFAQNEKYLTSLSFRPGDSVLKIDRKFSGSRRAVIHQRRCLVRKREQELKLRLVLDRYSVEVFVNDGEEALSATLYTPLSADQISFCCDGTAVFDVVKYDLLSED